MREMAKTIDEEKSVDADFLEKLKAKLVGGADVGANASLARQLPLRREERGADISVLGVSGAGDGGHGGEGTPLGPCGGI
jgi:hypothetical protein